jgi:iron complex outermembrane receptor protein
MRNSSPWRIFGVVLLAVYGAGTGALCFAQEGGQSGKEAVKEDQQAQQPQQQAQPTKEQAQPKKEEEAKPVGRYVEEMIVTAEKRPEDIQKIPVAVSTLSGSDLGIIMTAGPDIRAISGRVPSLTLESSFGRAFPRFYIRGLGNTDFDLNASQPVSMVVDEVVMENPIVKGMPLFDLDRIEVLRGPQGTLFGRNTPAGVIKFDTRRPSQEFESNFTASYGTYNNVDINGGIGGPLSKTLSARFSVLSQTQDNWVDNKWSGYKGTNPALGAYQTTAYRLQFLWEPSKDFSALLNMHGWDVNGTARIFRANIIKAGTNDFASGYKQDVVYQDGQNAQKIHSKGAMLRLDYKFGPATLTSVTGYETLNQMYSRGDIDGGYGQASLGPGNYGPGFIPFYSETADGIPALGQTTEELRLASTGSGPFQWLLGAYYFHENVKIDSYSYNSLSPGNPQEGFATQAQTTDSYAAFASLDYKLSEDWDIKAGVRYSNDKKDFAAERPWPVFQSPTVRPITEHTSDNNVSGDLSAEYRVNPNVNVYGKLATGYRGSSIQGRILFCADFEGGTNPATNCVSVAKPETIKSFEVGFKSILAGQRLRLNLAAYVFQMDDQQLTAVGGKYNTATLLNAKHTNGHGFEADVDYIISQNVYMSFGASWNPTKLDDRNLTVAPCGGGCTITNRTNATPTTPATLVYVNGNSLPYAPEWIFSGVFNVQSDPASKGYFGSLDWAYSSDKHFFLYESKEFHSDSLELGLRLGYGWDSDKYEVAVFARNLLNAKILQGGIDFDNLTGMTNEPRIIGVDFRAKF